MKKNNKTIKAKIALVLLVLALCSSLAYAAYIGGYSQIRYNKNFSLNASTISLMTHNTSRLYVTNEGLVGIGTTSPKATLTTIGDVYHNLSTVDKGFNIVNASGNSRFFVNNSNGYIGIGTESPSYELDVNGKIIGDHIIARDNLYVGNGDSVLSTTDNGNFSLGDNDYILFNGLQGVWTNTGKLGIGKTTPNFKLDVNGTINASGLNITGTIEADYFVGDGSLLTGIISGTSSPFNSSGLNIYLNDSEAKLGLGTSSPNKKLTVLGSINVTENITFSGGGQITYNSSANKFIWYDGTNWLTLTSDSSSVPANAIAAFYQEECPQGWKFADGTGGTPDLRGRMIIGNGSITAGGTHVFGFDETGGEINHTLSIDEMPTHTHTYKQTDIADGGSGVIALSSTGTNSNVDYTGGNDPHNNLPPYRALIYCMKTASSTKEDEALFFKSENNVYLNDTNDKFTVGTKLESPEKFHVEGNASVSKNMTISSAMIFDYNSTCAGFRFGSTGGLILSCEP